MFAFKFDALLTFFVCIMAHCANLFLRNHPYFEFKEVQFFDQAVWKTVPFSHQKGNEFCKFLSLNSRYSVFQAGQRRQIRDDMRFNAILQNVDHFLF